MYFNGIFRMPFLSSVCVMESFEVSMQCFVFYLECRWNFSLSKSFKLLLEFVVESGGGSHAKFVDAGFLGLLCRADRQYRFFGLQHVWMNASEKNLAAGLLHARTSPTQAGKINIRATDVYPSQRRPKP